MPFNKMYDFTVFRELRKQYGLSLKNVAEKAGISIAVISKLERNQTVAELETIYKLGKVFGMNPSELLSLAENRSAHKTSSKKHRTGSFVFEEILYGNIRCLYGYGKAGSEVSDPKVHRDDYEVCWVLNGRLDFTLPNERYELSSGESIQFDALLEHTYKAVEDTEFIILHLRKGKRF